MRILRRIPRAALLVSAGAVLAAAGAFAGTVTLSGGIVSAATTALLTPNAATYTYSPTVPTTATTPTTTVSTSCIIWTASLNSYIQQQVPTASQNHPTSLSVSSASSTTKKYALLQFTLPPPASCTGLAGGEVRSATLQLAIGTQVTGRTLNVLPITSAWSSTVNWNTQPSTGSPIATFTLTTSAVKIYSIDVTSTISELVRTGGWPVSAPVPPYATPAQQTNYGFELVNPTVATPDVISINSADSPQLRERPQLIIDYSY